MSQENNVEFIETWESLRGFLGWLAEVNNRPLGLRFMVTALIFFLMGGVMALLMRIQLAFSDLFSFLFWVA